MGRLVHRPITVSYKADRGPISLVLNGFTLPVIEVLETWQDTGCWWDGEGEKTFFRISIENNGLCEIYCEKAAWYLYRIYD